MYEQVRSGIYENQQRVVEKEDRLVLEVCMQRKRNSKIFPRAPNMLYV